MSKGLGGQEGVEQVLGQQHTCVYWKLQGILCGRRGAVRDQHCRAPRRSRGTVLLGLGKARQAFTLVLHLAVRMV